MKKKLRSVFWLLSVLIVGFFLVPTLLHLGYRLITTADEKEQKKKTYFALAQSEIHITEKEKLQKSQNERERIYYWFHSRGWAIDEGDGEPRFAESWRKLFRYWNENGA
jgi:hypothetical protein